MSSFQNTIRLRPRFRITVEKHTGDVLQALKKCYDDGNYFIIGKFIDDHIQFKIQEQHRHLWSPEMGLEIVAHEKGTVIRGLVGPNSQIWTFIAFAYGFLAFLVLVLLMWGLTLLSLQQDAKVLFLIPVLLVIALVVYLIAGSGKKVAEKQIHHLLQYLEDSLIDVPHELEES